MSPNGRPAGGRSSSTRIVIRIATTPSVKAVKRSGGTNELSQDTVRTVVSAAHAHEQAAHLPRVVGQAGEAAPGDHARARGRRRRRAVDDDVQPGTIDPRPARRADPRGGFRRLRVRPGRLDDAHPDPARSRPGVAARQRGVRGRALRRRPRDAAHVHPARQRREAAERPARPDLRALRPTRWRGRGPVDQSEAAQGDRGRRSLAARSRGCGGSSP